jgi:hypothetical protein
VEKRRRAARATRPPQPQNDAGLSPADRIYFLVCRKPAGLLLRKSQPAIDGNLEHAADPGHQLDIGTVFLNEPVPRTEGTRFIVSRLAPLDPDLHSFSRLQVAT